MTLTYAKTGRIPGVRGVGYVQIGCLVTPRTRCLNSWKVVPQGRSALRKGLGEVMALKRKSAEPPPLLYLRNHFM
jgi:hypothetical protein